MEMRDTPLKSALGIMAIGKLKGFGPSAHGKIASHFATFGDLLDSNEAGLIACTNVSQRNTLMGQGKALLTAAIDESKATLAKTAEFGTEPVTIYDDHYPQRLRNVPNHPVMFYCAGELSVLERTIAVIGGTQKTEFSGKLTERLVGAFVEQKWGIITGLEAGLQAQSHHVALDGGVVGGVVLGSGIDKYNWRAEELLIKVSNEGGVVLTEQPLGQQAEWGTQTRRYRLITALSAATLFLPCEQESPEMHALKYALSQGKQVMAPAIPASFADESANKALINLTRMSPEQYATLCGWKEEYLEAAQQCQRATAAHPIRNRDDYPDIFEMLELELVRNNFGESVGVDIEATFP